MADSAALDPPIAVAGGVHASVPHDSALAHATGAALYVDDLPEPAGLLHVVFGQSPHAHARIVSMDLAPVSASSFMQPTT